MTGISLVLAVLLGQAPDRVPADLVRQLGSAKYAVREAAMAAAAELGPAALPRPPGRGPVEGPRGAAPRRRRHLHDRVGRDERGLDDLA